uniref:Uncharacterized protein n=1 Tax=Melopsittacus undulatus TaxID=13146 RepID=A0A8V5G0B2_MELUD
MGLKAFMRIGEGVAKYLINLGVGTMQSKKKHTNFTLCNVCNIQLNSAAQAQIHYNGKSHQKRLKQLSNGNLKGDNGKLKQIRYTEQIYSQAHFALVC